MDQKSRALFNIDNDGLYPETKILLPSQRMLQIVEAFFDNEYPLTDQNNISYPDDVLLNILENILYNTNSLCLTGQEKQAWESMKAIYEFKSLLCYFYYRWLLYIKTMPHSHFFSPAVTSDDGANAAGAISPHETSLMLPENNLIIKIRYKSIRNAFDSLTKPYSGRRADGKNSEPLVTGFRIIVSFIITALSMFVAMMTDYRETIIFPYPFTISITNPNVFIPLVIAVPVFYLTWAFLSWDFVKGVTRFFGSKKYSVPLSVGFAETEHFTLYAPDGLTFCPKKSLLRNTLMNSVDIIDVCTTGDERSQANFQATLSVDLVSLRMSQKWNNSDPWQTNESTSDGHRFRRFAYSENEAHSYILSAHIRPKVGKRGLGYLLTILLTMGVFTYLYSYSFTSNDILPFVSMLLPLACAALTTREDEPFTRKAMMLFPRAGWKLSIALLMLGSMIYFGYIELWFWFYWISMVLLIFPLLYSLVWYHYHKHKDKWVRRFMEFPVFPLKPKTPQPK
ncbi:MAG: hypothetical protein LBD25_04635 [Coriobacteriales bacterium]|nr:hypothetical protein [Coriobacteriales bacterium]